MAQDLRDFLRRLEGEPREELLRIKEEVDPRYEATALALELERRGRCPALVFERVGAGRIGVVSNLYATRRRLGLALGVTEEEVLAELHRRERAVLPPRVVTAGSCHEVVRTGSAVDLGELPVLTHFEQDAGPYLTAGVIVAKDPHTGTRNASIHRLQVVGRDRLRSSLHSRSHLWEYQRRAEERGEALPIVIFVGAHPLVYLGTALWQGPIDADEYETAGAMLGEPLEIVPGRTVPVEAPAQAEVVLEGEILPGVREPEGPFGEYTGYAAPSSTQHAIRITALCRRREALYQDIVSGNSAEHLTLVALYHEARLLRALRAQFPTVRAVHYPRSGTGSFHCYIQMKKTAPGQPKNVVMAAFAADLSLKLAVVVDEDVDPRREAEVLWAVATRVQADRDLLVIPGAQGSILDPSAQGGETAKVGIDATRPSTDFPPRISLPEAAAARARALLASSGSR